MGLKPLNGRQAQKGLYNSEFCTFLLANGNYPDWVATSAFYAAMHLVQSRLFPFDYQGKSVSSIDNYHFILSQKRGNAPSKHALTKQLVAQHISAVSNDYRWLFDTCMNARYSLYTLSNQQANAAVQAMERIKAHCT